jgi:hypothetical protein
MAKTKFKSSDRGSVKAEKAAGAMLTTAFMTKKGRALPKGSVGFTFRAPANTVEVWAEKPAKVKPLLEGYSDAVATSRRTGRTMSFQVEVDPSGAAKVTPMNDAARVEVPDDLSNALDEARARGRLRVADILAGQEMLNADAFAELLGTTRMTVNTKRKNHQVLALDGAKRGFRFPAWQVGDDGKPFAAIPALFERLGGGPWAVYRFLVQTHPELEGLTAREALRRGRAADVLDVAEGVAQGTFA